MSDTNQSTSGSPQRPRVVIIGAGFGGINAAHGLRKVAADITIVDSNNFHTFQPLLYQVSTGYLSAEEVGSTVRSIFRRQRNVTVRLGSVVGADWSKREVLLDTGESIPFDYLVIAAGATTNFFGIKGMDQHAWPLYTLEDAVDLRNHLLTELERAASTPEAHPERSTVVVVGGGPTGVEMGGALSAMGDDLIGGDAKLRVVLLEAAPRLLNGFSTKSARRALSDLNKRGVEVRLATAVAGADDYGVDLANGERIEARTVVWGAGVRPAPLAEMLDLANGPRGAIAVGPDLQVQNLPGGDPAAGSTRVFAIGDIASIESGDGSHLPQLAPVAIQGGKHVAEQIARIIEGHSTQQFHYFDKGIMAVLGRGNAVAEVPLPKMLRVIKRLSIGGRLAWLSWLGVHIVYLIGFRNRLKVLVDWGWNYFMSRGASAILIEPSEKRNDA